MNPLLLMVVLTGAPPLVKTGPVQVTQTATGPTFIEDEFAKAMATAKAQKKLLLVDAWASWCHSCIFMREHVFTRPAFKKFEDRVVFSAIDTEKTKSAPFLEKYPVDVWPTLFIIDAKTGTIALKWIGSADENQLEGLLKAASETGAVATADSEMASGNLAAAAKTYLTVKEPSVRATLSTLAALSRAKENETCAKTAVDRLPEITPAEDRANALSWGLGCALEMVPSEARTALLAKLVPEATALLKTDGVLADDVSGLYEQLVDEAKSRKDEKSAKALALAWLEYLEGAAKAATTPAARAVFDPHRVSAAIEAGVPERALEALTQSAQDFPTDYNPPARQAVILRELKRYPEALTAADKALALCTQGPRKLRLYENKASIQVLTKDEAGRQATLKEAVRWAEKLPRSQVKPERVAALKAQLASQSH